MSAFYVNLGATPCPGAKQEGVVLKAAEDPPESSDARERVVLRLGPGRAAPGLEVRRSPSRASDASSSTLAALVVAESSNVANNGKQPRTYVDPDGREVRLVGGA